MQNQAEIYQRIYRHVSDSFVGYLIHAGLVNPRTNGQPILCQSDSLRSVINAFLKNLSKQLGCASIPVIIVPGNHDIVISDDARKIHDIIGWQKVKKMDAHLFEEMGHLENFFKYAKSNNRYFTCDTRNPLYVSKILPFEDVKNQFCILNSAPFSTREPDDKQVHYFPSYVEDSLSRSDEATLKITVMHHHFEWFEWDTKEMLKRLIASDDFTFFGHDHKAEELSTQYADGKKYDIIMGGEFNLDVRRDSAFNAVTYDSETSLIERFEFNWGINVGVFKPENRGYITKKSNKLIPLRNFLDKLLSDSAKVDGCIENTEDYFVFPKLTAEGGAFPKNDNIYSGVIQEQDIFNALKSDKAIRITGSVGSGKTTLINHLYAHSVDYGFIPLLIERGDYRDSKIDRMFKDLFEDQYGWAILCSVGNGLTI